MLDPVDAIGLFLRTAVPGGIGSYRSAALFDVGGNDREHFMWKLEHPDLNDEWLDEFFMPFGSVILSMKDREGRSAAAMLTRDPSIRGLRAPAGLVTERMVSAKMASDLPGCLGMVVAIQGKNRKDGWLVVSGGFAGFDVSRPRADDFLPVAITFSRLGSVVGHDGSVSSPWAFDDVVGNHTEAANTIADCIHLNITSLLRRLWWALQPQNWIVKHIPEMAARVQRGRLPFMHERERYLVMSQAGIERMFRLPNPDNAGRVLKVGHRRRACWHTLKHERFGEHRGERRYVRGCWVGPEEVSVGGERYRVLLDSPGWNPADLPDLPDDAIEIP